MEKKIYEIIPVYTVAGTIKDILIDVSLPYPTYSEMGDEEVNDTAKAQGRKIAEILVDNVPAEVFDEVMYILQYYVEHNKLPPKPEVRE